MVTLTRVPHSRPTTSLCVRENTIGRSHPGPMRPVSHVRRRLSNGYGMFLLFGKQNKHVLSTRQHTRQLTNLPCDRWVGPTPTQKTVLELATLARAYKTEKKRDIRLPSPPIRFILNSNLCTASSDSPTLYTPSGLPLGPPTRWSLSCCF